LEATNSLSAIVLSLHGIHYRLKSNSITVHSDFPKSQCFTDFSATTG